MTFRHQHGLLTKLAFSAVTHPHHRGWCARQPVSKALCGTRNNPARFLAGNTGGTTHPVPGPSICQGAEWLLETTLWGHTGLGSSPSSAR